MRAIALIGLQVLAAGCASSLSLKVERFQISGEAEVEYKRLHPPLTPGDRALQLSRLLVLLPKYRDGLKALNVAAVRLFVGISNPDEQIQAKSAVIDRAIDDVLAEVNREIAELPSNSDAQILPDTRLLKATGSLKKKLDDAKVVYDEAQFKKVVDQIKSLSSSVLADNAQKVSKDLAALFPGGVAALDRQVQVNLKALSSNPTAAQLRQFLSTTAESTIGAGQSFARIAVGDAIGYADLIERRGNYYEDLTDQFWSYISKTAEGCKSNPDCGWKALKDPLEIHGTGDTQYIVVFQSPIDPEVKLASADPTSVIQTNLSLARKALQVGVAVAGIATVPFPVPGTGALSGSDSGDSSPPDLDFSTLTAKLEQLKTENQNVRACLLEVRNWALAKKPPSGAAAALVQQAGNELKTFLDTHSCSASH